uniref:Nonspecific lipid-transfer protein AKCS9 n=1 Tax=Solanum tuberosum TaxID=4113 RepID=M1BYU9_SOLTU
MTKATSFVAIFLVGAMAFFLGEFLVTAQVPLCDNRKLSPCGPAFVLNESPTKECCATLKEVTQKCFCEFLRNPVTVRFVEFPQDVFGLCKLPFPTC